MYAYYYVHRDKALDMRARIAYVFMFLSLLMMIKTYSVIQKKTRFDVCASCAVRICIHTYIFAKAFTILVHPYMKIICVAALCDCLISLVSPLVLFSLVGFGGRVWMCAFALKNYDHFVFRENCLSEHDFLPSISCDVSVYVCVCLPISLVLFRPACVLWPIKSISALLCLCSDNKHPRVRIFVVWVCVCTFVLMTKLLTQ